MTTGREAIVWLLVRRVRALSLLAWIERRTVDASVILHYLGKPECVMAMKGANEYLGAARTQMDRIEPAMRAWYDVTDRSRVFHEIHYYFICWDAIWKRLMVIKKRSGLRSVRPILQKHHVEAEHYAFGRDQLEHYDEWLEGRPRYRSLAPWDAGNLDGSNYTLAGRRWDVSRASLQRLEDLVREVADAVMREGKAELMRREMTKDA